MFGRSSLKNQTLTSLETTHFKTWGCPRFLGTQGRLQLQQAEEMGDGTAAERWQSRWEVDGDGTPQNEEPMVKARSLATKASSAIRGDPGEAKEQQQAVSGSASSLSPSFSFFFLFRARAPPLMADLA